VLSASVARYSAVRSLILVQAVDCPLSGLVAAAAADDDDDDDAMRSLSCWYSQSTILHNTHTVTCCHECDHVTTRTSTVVIPLCQCVDLT